VVSILGRLDLEASVAECLDHDVRRPFGIEYLVVKVGSAEQVESTCLGVSSLLMRRPSSHRASDCSIGL
jgi:hypothetical protein